MYVARSLLHLLKSGLFLSDTGYAADNTCLGQM
jgi:hypothetical protein